MYNRENLKLMLKKTNTKIKSLQNAIAKCNTIVYTEQNAEELTAVKEFIVYKLNLQEDIYNLIKNYIDGKCEHSEEQFYEDLESFKALYNEVCKNDYLTHLQKIYSNTSENEIKSNKKIIKKITNIETL